MFIVTYLYVDIYITSINRKSQKTEIETTFITKYQKYMQIS